MAKRSRLFERIQGVMRRRRMTLRTRRAPFAAARAGRMADLSTAMLIEALEPRVMLSGVGPLALAGVHEYAVGPMPSQIATGDFNNDGLTDTLTVDSAGNRFTLLMGDGVGGVADRIDVAGPPGAQLLTVAVGQLNGDGNLDAVFGTGQLTAGDGSVVVMLGNGDGSFNVGTPLPVAGLNSGVALGLVDGDSNLDIVAVGVYSGAGNATVLLGNGAGAFGSRQDRALPNEPAAVALGDVNGDTFLDAVTADTTANSVSVLLGNGAGMLGAASPMTAGREPTDVKLGDVDGDMALDIVTSNRYQLATTEDGAVNVLLGNGVGGFSMANEFSAGLGATAVALGDVDGDTNLDVVTVNTRQAMGDGSVSVLLGDGSGTFDHRVDLLTNGGPSSLALVDLNGDMRPDLAVAHGDNDNVLLLLNDGNGRFPEVEGYSVAGPPEAMALGDVDGDGETDLVFVSEYGYASPTLTVLLGTGLNSFDRAFVFDVSVNASALALGDVNGDSRLDAFIAGEDPISPGGLVLVMLGNGDGTFAPPSSIFLGQRASAIAVAQVNDDVDANPDLLVADDMNNTVTVLTGNGAGGFAAGGMFTVGAGPHAITVADVNNDNNLDAVTANSTAATVTVLLGDGMGAFVPQADLPVGAGPNDVALGDVDNDTKLDLVTANTASDTITILRGDGMGGFAMRSDVDVALMPEHLALGDLDNDSDLDIAAAGTTAGMSYYQSEAITILLGDGTGAFNNRTDLEVAFSPAAIALADLNHDGKLELIASDGGNQAVSILPGLGNGGFGGLVDYLTPEYAQNVAVGDVDGDGDPDVIAVSNYYVSELVVFLNNGDGSLSGVRRSPVTSINPLAITVGDLNGDNLPDVVLTGDGISGSVAAVFIGDGSGGFSPGGEFALPSGPGAAALGLVDGDSNLDLVTANGESSNISVLLGDGAGGFGPRSDISTGGLVGGLALGDVDNDTFLDIVTTDVNGPSVTVLFGDGAGAFGGVVNFAVANSPTAVALGDLDGDNDLDVVVGGYLYDPAAMRNVGAASILLGDGMGGFGGRTDHVTGADVVERTLIGDLTGDGQPDVATVNLAFSMAGDSSISVLPNAGGGVFPRRIDLRAEEVSDLLLSDMDGDGDPDVVVTGGALAPMAPGGVNVVINAAPPSNPPPNGPFVEQMGSTLRVIGGDGDDQVTITGQATSQVRVVVDSLIDQVFTGVLDIIVAGQGGNDTATLDLRNATVHVIADGGPASTADQVILLGDGGDNNFVLASDAATDGVNLVEFVANERLTVDASQDGADQITIAQGFFGALFSINVVGGGAGTDTLSLASTDVNQFVKVRASGVDMMEQTPPDLTLIESQFDGTGGVDGLGGATVVAVSPDGHTVYAGSQSDNAVAVFQRDTMTGALTQVQVVQDLGGSIPGALFVDGLGSVETIAVSPDGAHVYVGSFTDDAVVVFARDFSTGQLSFVQVLQDPDSASPIAGATPVQGLDITLGLALSPDGNNVYAAGFRDDALVVFDRDGNTGQLTAAQTFQDPDTPLARQISGAIVVDGLSGADTVTVSPDGGHVYVGAVNDDSVVAFTRDAMTGALTLKQVIQDNDALAPVAGATIVDGLVGVSSVVVSPDGANVYVGTELDDSVVVLSRNPTSGILTPMQMFQDPGGGTFPATGAIGVDGLDTVFSVAVSADGRRVYATGDTEAALFVFQRDAMTGALTATDVFQDDAFATIPGAILINGLDGSNFVTVSPDGRHVYVAALADGAVTVLAAPAMLGVDYTGITSLIVATGAGDDLILFEDGATLNGGNSVLDTGAGTDTLDYSLYMSPVMVDLPNMMATGVGVVFNAENVLLPAGNTPPMITVPSTQQTREDGALDFSAANGNPILIGDAESGATDNLEVSLAVMNGAITLVNGVGALSFTVGDGAADPAMTFQGTLSQINAALDGLRFVPAPDFNGSTTLLIDASDLGLPLAPPMTSNTSVDVDVLAVNDPPMLAVPGPQVGDRDTDQLLTGLNVSDRDANPAADTVALTLSAMNGVLIVDDTVSGGLAPTDIMNNGSGAVSMAGTLDQINATLAVGVTYRPDPGFAGQDTVAARLDDQGAVGLLPSGLLVGPTGRALMESLRDGAGATFIDFQNLSVGTQLSIQLAGQGVNFATISDENGNPIMPLRPVRVSSMVPGTNTIVGELGSSVQDTRPVYEVSFASPQRFAGLERIFNTSTITRFFNGTTLLAEFQNTFDDQFVAFLSDSNDSADWITHIEMDGQSVVGARQTGFSDDLFFGTSAAPQPLTDTRLIDITVNQTLPFVQVVGTELQVRATAGDDVISVLPVGPGQVRVTIGPVGFDQTFMSIDHIVINGDNGDDTLTVDFTAGNPVPTGGIDYDGGANGAGGDRLQLQGGMFADVTHNAAGPGAGSVVLDGSTITYTGLEPVLDTTAADTRAFNLGPGAAGQARLGDDGGAGNGLSRFDDNGSGAFESVTFAAPNVNLLVNGSNGADTIIIAPLDSLLTAAVTVDGGDGNDVLDAAGFNRPITLSGGAGDDMLRGGPGNDMIGGGADNDTIVGGPGDDQLFGNDGDDTFLFADGWGTDTLTELAGQGVDAADFTAVTTALTFSRNPGVEDVVTDGVNTVTAPGGLTVESFLGVGPQTALAADDLLAAGQSVYQFDVTYIDAVNIVRASIDGNDIRVTGPMGFDQLAAVIGIDRATDDTTLVVTYEVTAQRAAVFSQLDNGTYTVRLQNSQVGNVDGGFATPGVLGTFDVLVSDDAPTALASVAPITQGAPTHTFSVVYRDDTLIDLNTLDNDDVLVTGPGGFSQQARFIGAAVGDDGATAAAVYRIVAPNGSWQQSDNGVYTVRMLPGQVSDEGGNAVPPGTLTRFRVKVPPPPPPPAPVDLVGAVTALDLDATVTPGSRGLATVMVSNIIAGAGAGTARGFITIDLFAVSGATAGPGSGPLLDADTVPVGRIAYRFINLAPGDAASFRVPILIPPELPPGDFRIAAVVDSQNDIIETVETNNAALAAATLSNITDFGNTEVGKVLLRLEDNDGSRIAFVLSGPGMGQVVAEGNGFNLILTGTDIHTSVTVVAGGGDGHVALNDVSITGSLASFYAGQFDLLGDFTITGTLHNLYLHDVADPHVITIGPPTSATDKVAMTFARVTDCSVTSQTGIRYIRAVDWLDSDDMTDTITAPFLEQIIIIGGGSSHGDFQADLVLDGTGAGAMTMITTYIRGDLTDADWSVTGDIGTIIVLGRVQNWSLTVASNVRLLNLGVVDSADVTLTNGRVTTVVAQQWSAGSLSAQSVGVLIVTGRGAGDGGFGADLHLSGGGGASRTLGVAMVQGAAGAGAWVVDAGDSGAVILGSADDGFSASFAGQVLVLIVRGDFSGDVAAAGLGGVLVTGDVVGATVLAGALFGADGRLGGAGADADTFGPGAIRYVSITGSVTSSVIGAGLDPVDGLFHNGDDVLLGGAASRIASLFIVGPLSNDSFIAAGSLPTVVYVNRQRVTPATDPRFLI